MARESMYMRASFLGITPTEGDQNASDFIQNTKVDLHIFKAVCPVN